MDRSIVIVDDHLLLGQSLKAMIEGFEGFKILAVLQNGKELVKYYKEGKPKPDLVLLDIQMPVMNGLDTMEWLQKNQPAQKVLALSMEDDETIIITMVKLGVKGYILKDIKPNEFKTAIKTVLEGNFYYSDSVSEKISKCSLKKDVVEELKENELEFLKLACTEMTYKQIASTMSLSPKTIENYRENLFQKLEVKSRVGLVVYAIRNEIYSL